MFSTANDFEADFATVGRKLHRVAQQVDQNLFESPPIGAEFRDGGIEPLNKVEVLLLRLLAYQAHARLAKRTDGDEAQIQLNPARLNFRHIKHIIDQVKQMPPALFNRAQRDALAVAHLAIKTLAAHLCSPQDCVEWRAELVAHIRQKLILDPGGAG